MKKTTKILIVTIIAMLVLYGCSFEKTNVDNIDKRMNKAIELVIEQPVASYQNMNKSLYGYFLPLHVGKRDSTAYSNLLIIDNHEVLMSLNPSSIIIDQYYKGNSSKKVATYDIAIYSKVFKTTDYANKNLDLSVSIFEFEQYYYMLVKSAYFTFLTTAPLEQMPIIIQDIIRIIKTTYVNKEKVLATYSRKEAINYQQQATTIFSQSIPENGTLAEMLENYFPNYDFSDDSQNFNQDNSGEQNYPHDEEE